MAIRPRAGRERAGARGIEPVRAMLLRQPQDAQARAIALLGMGPALEQRLDERLGVAPDRGAPADQRRGSTPDARGAPSACAPGPSCGSPVDSCAHAATRAPRAGARRRSSPSDTFDGGMNQRVRDRVIVPIDLDVIIDVDARVTPVGVDVAIARERLQRRLIEPLESARREAPPYPFIGRSLRSVSSVAIRPFNAARVKKVCPAAGRESSARRPARRLRPSPCRAASPAGRERSPSRSAAPSPHMSAGPSAHTGTDR